MKAESGDFLQGWIIYYKKAALYNKRYIEFYIEEGSKLGVDVKLIILEDLNFGVSGGELYVRYKNSPIKMPDFAICRAIYPLLSEHLEGMGIKVFNNSKVASICNDKARTYQYLAGTGIPMVESSFCKNPILQDRINEIKGPSVIKAVEGHGGSQVFLLNDVSGDNIDDQRIDGASRAEEILLGIEGSDVVIQPLIGKMHQDLRVYVIGERIIAAVLRTARAGFKSNYSLGGQVDLYQLSDKEIALIEKIIDQFDFGLVGVDFLISDQGDLIFNEIEDVVGSRMLYKCSDINIVSLYLQYILEQL